MPVIAVDGPAAAGKGTLARRLAERYGFAHLDTGGLYRAVALRLLDGPGELAGAREVSDADAARRAAEAVAATDLASPRLREEAVGRLASMVSAIPEVRDALLAFQRRFAAQAPGAVLDGRDIGTVVCPQAAAKLFVTAAPEARARRRFEELRARDQAVMYAAVLQDLMVRDARDRERPVAPLAPAPDAFVLDTTALGIEAAFAAAAAYVDTRLSALRG